MFVHNTTHLVRRRQIGERVVVIDIALGNVVVIVVSDGGGGRRARGLERKKRQARHTTLH
jgi:hypothetical protein